MTKNELKNKIWNSCTEIESLNDLRDLWQDFQNKEFTGIKNRALFLNDIFVLLDESSYSKLEELHKEIYGF